MGSMQAPLRRYAHRTGQEPELDTRAWAVAWGGVVAAAFVNGALHRAYGNVLDELTAHQVSTVVLLVLLAPWALHVERNHPLATARDAATVGALWAGCSVAFEFVFGHYVNGDSWAALLNAYDVTDGRMWLLDVVGIAVAPWLARAWRLRRRSA